MTNTNAKTAAAALRAGLVTEQPKSNSLADKIAQDLIDTLNEWHALPEVYDNALDAQIHRWYAGVKSVFPKKPYFSPSSANSCPRELYMKSIGAKKDTFKRPPHQARWQRIGTNIGDIIQRDLLFIEKHSEAKLGKPSRFRFERDEYGRPMFEDFAKINKPVNHRGHSFNLFGTPDGIMRYTTDNGEEVRVGLEVKSKQTTPAQTSLYSMKEPDIKHVKQTVAYSIMYADDFGKPLDYYVILYVNAAKVGWVIDDETFAKTPDIRAFGLEFTDSDRTELLDYLADVMDAIKAKQPPKLDIDKWTFNGFKTAIAKGLTDDELTELRTQVERIKKSRMPDWKKRGYIDALEFIEGVRNHAGA